MKKIILMCLFGLMFSDTIYYLVNDEIKEINNVIILYQNESRIFYKDINGKRDIRTQNVVSILGKNDEEIFEFKSNNKKNINTINNDKNLSAHTKKDDTYYNCYVFAQNNYASDAGVYGFGTGLFLGLIGTGLGYALISNSYVETPYYLISELSLTDAVICEKGYRKFVVEDKRNRFLSGGIVGSVIAALIITSN